MFKWNKKNPTVESVRNGSGTSEESVKITAVAEKKSATLDSVQELLTKNLKWSQIIYEQNRKINNKLLWTAIASWLRLLIIVVPLVLAIWFLPPLVRDLMSKYEGLLGQQKNTNITNNIDQYLKLLPLDVAKQEQLKTILK